MGEEALGTGVGVSIRKTWRASQIIADEGRVVGNRGFVLGTGGGGRVEGWEAGLQHLVEALTARWRRSRLTPPVVGVTEGFRAGSDIRTGNSAGEPSSHVETGWKGRQRGREPVSGLLNTLRGP